MTLPGPIVFSVLAALGAATAVGCGRTDLELTGRGGQGGVFPVGGGGARSGGRSGSGGGGGTAGRGATGGATGSGGRVASGGAMGTGGRTGSGGAVDAGVRDAVAEGLPVVDAAGPDLPPSTPGTLTCGIQLCSTKTQSCCVSIAAGAVGAQCVPLGSTCGGAGLDCDEPADCAGGTCCFGLQLGGVGGVAIGSRCVARVSCAGLGRFVVCRTNSDCGGTNPVCCLVAGGVPVCQPTCR